MARIGKKATPFYKIVAIDSRKKRDGQFIEDLGTFDGLNNALITFRADRFNDWVSKGAIPTDAVKKIYRNYSAVKAA